MAHDTNGAGERMSGDIAPYARYSSAYVIDPDMERARMVEAMMREHLSHDQMHLLRDALESVFMPSEGAAQSNDHYIRMFLDAKRVENLSVRTIKYYGDTLRACIGYIDRPIRLIDANDIRRCLSWALTERKVSPTTANNERRVLSSFFQWLENEDIIRKSPVKRTKSIREERADKKPFSDEDVTRMRESLRDVREKAIFELLLSSGMRVSELCGLDRDDMDMHERECEVLGKGSKRRMCYFSAAAKLYTKQYLKGRDDSNPALFVAKARPHNRLTVGAVESMMRNLGRRAKVDNVHPHRFRRTFATDKLRRGMKLEEIQQLLGHTNMDTTLIYAKIDREMLKVNARRLT